MLLGLSRSEQKPPASKSFTTISTDWASRRAARDSLPPHVYLFVPWDVVTSEHVYFLINHRGKTESLWSNCVLLSLTVQRAGAEFGGVRAHLGEKIGLEEIFPPRGPTSGRIRPLRFQPHPQAACDGTTCRIWILPVVLAALLHISITTSCF